MSNIYHLKALLQKNLILMKRNIFVTILEIFSPMILTYLLYLLRKSFKVTYSVWNENLTNEFLVFNSTTLTYESILHEIFFRKPILNICGYYYLVALIGNFPKEIKDFILKVKELEDSYIEFMEFDTKEDLDNYIKSPNYGYYYSDNEYYPYICFGIYFNHDKENNKYDISLHYHASESIKYRGYIPSTLEPNYDVFLRSPDYYASYQYFFYGFLGVMKLIYDYILRKETGNNDAYIDMIVLNNKFSLAVFDKFDFFMGFIMGFFLIITYVIPLSRFIFIIVKEKESKSKEGMKIMGLSEFSYFLSYFIHFFIFNLFYTIANSLILKLVLKQIPFIYILLFFFLFGLNIFALVFFFQSFLDKTRLAMIVSILIYFLMYFLSSTFIVRGIKHWIRVLSSIFPPIALQLGLNVMSRFEVTQKKFEKGDLNLRYYNYCMKDMFIMFTIDFFVFLFLGFYLQNIISHDFGISHPWYFLCTKSFWGFGKNKNKKTKEKLKTKINNIDNNINKNQNLYNSEENKINIYNQKNLKENNQNITNQIENLNSNELNNFEKEDIYSDLNKPEDKLKLKNIKKIFPDGKIALNGISLNLYKNEIFALLGHNGAGKSTLISILIGLYSSTEGEVEYNNLNILNENNMIDFRKILGICPQHDVLFPQLTVIEHLKLFCIFKGLTNDKIIKSEIEKSLHDFSLENKKDTIVEKLSGGQKRKLSIAIALIGGSKIIFLDEPTSGMDITSRRNLWDILKRYCDNRIIVLTTHYMEEASVLGKRIGIISNGNLICLGSSLFLIEKFGKFISINIIKEKDCVDVNVIEFIQKICSEDFIFEFEYEILNEEILFRIPKVNSKKEKFDFESFFNKLDSNIKDLKIKTYTASMATLEDVFLNVSSLEKMRNKEKIDLSEKLNINSDELLYDDSNYNQKYSSFQKFYIDLCVLNKKRFKQIYRDSKTFILEILCPILLILVGLIVSSVEYFPDNPSFKLSPSALTNKKQVIFYNNECTLSNNILPIDVIKGYDKSFKNFELEYLEIDEENTETLDKIIDFWNKVYYKNYTNNLGSYYCLLFDENIHQYQFLTVIDSRARQAAPVYTSHLFQNLIKYVTKNEKLEINFYNSPLPLTKDERDENKSRNNTTLVFFISIAFTLIPANFVTIIIKERETNTKHLQIISGVSLLSYWFNNFLFELVKYYFIGGFGLLLIYLFGFYKKYLSILYLLYGPSMIAFTYIFSFIFSTESSGQNIVIIVNFVGGALAGTVVLILRLFNELAKYGKRLQNFLRLIPAFCFCFGYNELLSKILIYEADYQYYDYIYNLSEDHIMKLKYVGGDCLYLGIEIIVYIFILFILENRKIIFKCFYSSEFIQLNKENFDENNKNNINNNNNNDLSNNNNTNNNNNDIILENNIENIKDSIVIKEIEKANKENLTESNYAIVVQNLIKTFTKRPFCNNEKTITKAVRNISFCLEYGECFGFLGVNGAGKTTTFKCLSNEYIPSYGRILIDNKELNTNFNEIRSLIGYCPQFDSIFEYLTVFENLEFYSKIKGMKEEKMKEIINALLIEMNLYEYKNIISGQLSGGNKRKLSVSIAMICNPPIILLDEPSTGMDPEARRFMWSVIHKISIRKKKSSVIMTTHSMEEAETLCQRIGIMVNGQFKCLGSSNYIKEKYGEGYEINLLIFPLSIHKMNDLIKDFDNKFSVVNLNNIKEILCYYNKKGFVDELNKGRFGYKIIKELEIWNEINLHKLFTWVYYVENALKLIKIIKRFFNNIKCCDFVDNNFVFRIKREHSQNEKTIGFLFGLIEKSKSEFNIEEYSIQLTSLEQIFNQFAKEMENNENFYDLEKIDIEINNELYDKLGI